MENRVVENQPVGKAIASFVISIVASAFSYSLILCVPGMVLGIIGYALSSNTRMVTQRPYVTFRRVAAPLSIVSIVVGAVATTGFIIFFLYLAFGGTI